MDPLARAAGLRVERARASSQWSDGVFRNTHSPRMPSPSGGTLGEFLFKRGRRVPDVALPVERPHEAWARRVESGFRATWLGHSTVLLELDGRRVLTDPVFADRIGPLGFVGPRRFHATPAAVEELPPLDAILLSHDHFDHLCASSIAKLAKSGAPIVTALGVGAHLASAGFDPSRITELDWHESVELGGLRFTATPAQHFSGRGLLGRNKTLWASWVVESERRKVFFSGDTGLTPEFADVGRAHGPFDLVMLEVGAFHPSWGTIHLGPDNALEAFAMLGGGTLLPVHWGTFNLALHDWDEPAETLLHLAAARGARVLTPRLGAPFEPEHVEGPSPWWRGLAPERDRAALASPAVSLPGE